MASRLDGNYVAINNNHNVVESLVLSKLSAIDVISVLVMKHSSRQPRQPGIYYAQYHYHYGIQRNFGDEQTERADVTVSFTVKFGLHYRSSEIVSHSCVTHERRTKSTFNRGTRFRRSLIILKVDRSESHLILRYERSRLFDNFHKGIIGLDKWPVETNSTIRGDVQTLVYLLLTLNITDQIQMVRDKIALDTSVIRGAIVHFQRNPAIRSGHVCSILAADLY